MQFSVNTYETLNERIKSGKIKKYQNDPKKKLNLDYPNWKNIKKLSRYSIKCFLTCIVLRMSSFNFQKKKKKNHALQADLQHKREVMLFV